LQFDQALAAYREALDLLRAAFAELPQNTRLMENVSVAYAKVALVLGRMKRPDETVENYRAALALRQKLVELDPSNWNWRALLAEVSNRLAAALSQTGKLEEARPLFRDSIERYRAISQHDPRNAVWRRNLAIGLNLYAFAILATDRAGALDAFHESVPIFRELASGASPPASALVDLVRTLLSVAELGEDARKNYEEALSLLQRLEQQGALPEDLRPALSNIKAGLEKLPKQ
ncbi:MAG: tetratricopeptide repeat protein, partial [Pseudolabrys sp.]|nr:tetratricopeptide repeat protein [Pseudolabrys sp.]